MKKQVIVFLVILVIFSYGCVKPSSEISEEVQETPEPVALPDQSAIDIKEPNIVPEEEVAESPREPIEKVPVWVYGGPAIEGNYADSDFVYLDNDKYGHGKYRMYYAIEPEVPGNKLEVYSATSSDGITWVPEEGVRRTFTVFPDVVKLPDATWRMYFQNAGVIKSATSSDGLSWKDESGIRIDSSNNLGLTFENVAGPTTIADGSRYIMVYSGAIPGKYKDAPNNHMAVLLWATSSDGLKFEVQGMALDTRNDDYYGWADTPDLIHWDDGTIKMFFWGYFGIYESTFTGNGFTEPVMVYEAKDEDSMHRFPSSPPGDPTLGKVGDKWFMYYGQHTKGIYYATFEQSTPPQLSKPQKLEIPSSLENSCVGFKINGPDKVTTINLLGAGWATYMWPHFTWGRIEKEPGIFDFSEMDNVVKMAQESNVAILAELQPFADWDQAWDQNCRAKEKEYLCKPKDMQAYKRFVSKTVERYDGDGENDMPGLKIPIKYWQIVNEPDIKDDPWVIFFVGDAEDYFEVLRESYLTIKEVCPDCKVLQGAAAGVKPEFLSFWGDVFELGGADYFDIANTHYVGIDIATGRTVSLGDPSTLNVEPFKELLDSRGIKKPIWVTEAVLKSSNAKSWLQGALSAGASKVFFVGFGVEPSAPVGEFSEDFKGIVELCPDAS